MRASLILDLIAAILILLLCYTAFSKLAELDSFRYVLSHLMGIRPIATPVAWAIPLVELTVSLLLLIPAYRKAGLWSAAILLTIFTAYLAIVIGIDHDLPCSCGGVLKLMTWKQHLLFNIFFITLAVIGIRLASRAELFYCNKTGQAENLITE